MNAKVEIEKYVTKYGESHRQLVLDSLTWLESVEPTWELDIPIDRDDFIIDLLNRMVKNGRKTNEDSNLTSKVWQ